NYLNLTESITDEKQKSKIKKKKKKKKKGDKGELESLQKPQPKEFETKETKLPSKLEGKVKVKKKNQDLALELETIEVEKIELKKGEYIKLIGITSVDRTDLFCSNKSLEYLLELTNNLNFIATGILGGELDKMLLISEDDKEEKCQWYIKNNLIYMLYGIFPDKKGKWLLEQMSNHFSELLQHKDIDKLEKLEKYQIETKFKGRVKYLIEEYLKMQEVFSDDDISYVADKIRIDYTGLSSKSIGVISLLLGDELNVESPGTFDNPEEEQEMKESMLTAKIEAIAANTQGNTGATPRWIAVKLGFQHYRFLTFKKFQNDFFLYFLSEGNLEKIKIIEDQLMPYINHVVDKPFTGNLRPFNKLKMTLMDHFMKTREFS
ncbi:MAG: hypothetical protein ACTSPS_08675, partial [Promethearchaeota archaeon]